jgi:hypothetical protein
MSIVQVRTSKRSSAILLDQNLSETASASLLLLVVVLGVVLLGLKVELPSRLLDRALAVIRTSFFILT